MLEIVCKRPVGMTFQLLDKKSTMSSVCRRSLYIQTLQTFCVKYKIYSIKTIHHFNTGDMKNKVYRKSHIRMSMRFISTKYYENTFVNLNDKPYKKQ